MKKRILMVYPEFPDTYWSFRHSLPFTGKKSAFPPLGLLTVAAMLPTEYDVRLVDMNAETLDECLIDEADLVFVSAMIIQKASFDRIVAACIRIGTPVVAGGPYPTSSHTTITGVDHFIIGEAETTLHSFIGDFESGRAKRVYADNAKPDITKTPAPRLDLIDVSRYSNMLVQYSRGCPFNCEFCDIIEMFGRNTRVKTTGQFLKELDNVLAAGFRGGVFIVDDNFIGKKNEVKELLRAMIAWQEEHRYPFTFFTEASINCSSDDELLSLLSRAGFDMLFIGIETPDEAGLASANKSQNMNRNLMDCVRTIQRKGMEVAGGFIVGFDTDDETIFDRQIDFIQRAGIPISMVGLLTALPNTRLYRRLKEEGRLLSGSSGNNTHDLRLNFKPVMRADRLISGYKHIISSIYSPKEYFERCLNLLRSLPVKKASYRKVGSSEIRALLRSLIVQTFSSYGIHYLRFLLKSLMINIRLFPEAIGLSVKGHHLITITTSIHRADAFVAMLERVLMDLKNRLASLPSCPGRDVARVLERHAIHIISVAQRRYSRLTDETRVYVQDRIREFERQCIVILDRIRHELSGSMPSSISA
ncbi:MAG: B12-binding domain-containing radical SAM protein [Spirochaetes bacterium]|nr:B12-binding domain-containing radical SAM protein [Spirochaetota bacterium]